MKVTFIHVLMPPTIFIDSPVSLHLSISSPLLLTSQVRVVIVDENDCVPEFLQSIYSKDGVPETVTTATSLLQGETWGNISKAPHHGQPPISLSWTTSLSAMLYFYVETA